VNPAWVSAAVALAGVAGCIGLWILRGVWRMFKSAQSFLEDWNGKEEDRGHPRQAGVMERLSTLEHGNDKLSSELLANTQRLDSQDRSLNIIQSEVTLNSGHSIKDTVHDILAKVNQLQPPNSP
jgi:hypothetical protein